MGDFYVSTNDQFPTVHTKLCYGRPVELTFPLDAYWGAAKSSIETQTETSADAYLKAPLTLCE
jgi:hypothetical protein